MKKLNLMMVFAMLFSINLIESNERIPLEKLICYGTGTGVSMSPDGKYFAAMIPSGDVNCDITTPEEDVAVPILVVINLETMEKKQYSGTSLNSRISSATFINNEMLLVNRSCDRGAGSSGTVDCYSLYGINVVTGEREPLIRAKQTSTGQGVRYPSLFDVMPQYPNKIIITMNRMPQFPWRFRDLYWLDLETKRTTKIAEVPDIKNEWHQQWLIDHDGNARGFVTNHDDRKDREPNGPRDGLYTYVYLMDPSTQEYERMASCKHQEPCFMPLTFDFDNRMLFGVGQAVNPDGSLDKTMEYTNTNALWLYDTKKKEYVEKVFHDPFFDFSNPRQGYSDGRVLQDRFNKINLGLRYSADKTKYIYWDETYGYIRESVQATFPDRQIGLNTSADFSKVIISSSSDKSPGSLHYYDVLEGAIIEVADFAPWLKEYELGDMVPFNFKARDGVELTGYITLPPTYRKGQKIPFIVHPHGGPNAKDSFGYRPEVQIYATRGYGVLQVNYRGSVGFGLEKMKLANKQWSLAMHDDLLDALSWAVDRGFVDTEKVCISGASYGGYSAMVGITKNPDIFKCAVNYVGVVDLYTLYDDKQWMFADMGRPQQHIEMGNPNTERDILETASPINYVENIRGDLFVIHGRQDRQASYKQVLQLKEALEDADIPFEYMIKGDEGHGFYSETNNLELYSKMIDFLDASLNN